MTKKLQDHATQNVNLEDYTKSRSFSEDQTKKFEEEKMNSSYNQPTNGFEMSMTDPNFGVIWNCFEL